MFKLDQILTKNKYNKGVAATVRYDDVEKKVEIDFEFSNFYVAKIR